MPGTLLGYEILGELGKGAGSTIYAASHPQTHQLCALKHVLVQSDKDVRFVDQLRAEFDVGRKVTHTGLRRSFDLKIKSNWLGKPTEAALLMELVDGVPLDQELPAGGVIAIVDCFIQAANALHALHTMGYVHCDIKPANLLVSSEGVTKVIDLGQACPIGTQKQRIQGTPDYIAPEQVKREPVTPRTDVFNLGAALYACLSGQKLPTLFTAGKGENSFVVTDRIRTPHEWRPEIPENLSNLAMQCVRIKPEKRPEDMAELARRLDVIRFGMERQPAAVAGE
jgi:serine/threonine-protein kinase